jgi:hypothetical protein
VSRVNNRRDLPYLVLRSLLTDLVAGEVTSSRRSGDLQRAGLEAAGFWQSIIDQADYHGVLGLVDPFFRSLAESHAGTVPVEAVRALTAITIRNRRAAVEREKVVDDILSTFQNAAIDVLLLKGSALAHMVYERADLRPMVDVDLLVRPAQASDAVKMLRELGFIFNDDYDSKFGGHWHHLPAAAVSRGGFSISVELHLEALGPDHRQRIDFDRMTSLPRHFSRAAGPAGMALGHIDMLRHIGHHAFQVGGRVRLKHLYDLFAYKATFTDQIDWDEVMSRWRDVAIILELAEMALSPEHNGLTAYAKHDNMRVGEGMMMLSQIATTPMGLGARLDALFNPPAWWLHGHYGVPTNQSLFACRFARHPINVGGWIGTRLVGYLSGPSPLPFTAGEKKNTAEESQ